MSEFLVEGGLEVEELTRVEWQVLKSQCQVVIGNSYKSGDFYLAGERWHFKLSIVLSCEPHLYTFGGIAEKQLCVTLLREVSTAECRLNYSLGWKKPDGSLQITKHECICIYPAGRATCKHDCCHNIDYYKLFAPMNPANMIRLRHPISLGDRATLRPFTIVVNFKRERPPDITFVGVEKLSHDLNELLQSGEDSDLTVQVKGVEFRLHRNIMRVRTPVFSAMFRHEMREKATGIVRIDDCEADVFRAFVRYLYSGKLDDLSTDTVFGLFVVADKYQVDELKSACLEFIKSTLSTDTFCSVVSLALAYQMKDLLEQAMDHFALHMPEVLQTVPWMNFMKERPIEANELMLKSVVKRDLKK